jgi:hypothetical protein
MYAPPHVRTSSFTHLLVCYHQDVYRPQQSPAQVKQPQKYGSLRRWEQKRKQLLEGRGGDDEGGGGARGGARGAKKGAKRQAKKKAKEQAKKEAEEQAKAEKEAEQQGRKEVAVPSTALAAESAAVDADLHAPLLEKQEQEQEHSNGRQK